MVSHIRLQNEPSPILFEERELCGFLCVCVNNTSICAGSEEKKNSGGFSLRSWVRKDPLAHSFSLISDSARGTVRITVLIRGKLGQDLN